MPNCIFCKIIRGEIPSYQLYEDEKTVAFLDLHPIRTGHALVIPKIHEPDIHHLPDADYNAVMRTAKTIANSLETAIRPKRVGFLVAGWDVPHVHVHVVPMEEFHDLTSQRILDGTRGDPSPEELDETAQKIRSATNR